MYSIVQPHVQSPAKADCIQSEKGKVILLESALNFAKKRTQPCIFCGTTIRIQNFKGKTVCSSCLQHIPHLFPQKRVQLV